jgi:hypothetical protein
MGSTIVILLIMVVIIASCTGLFSDEGNFNYRDDGQLHAPLLGKGIGLVDVVEQLELSLDGSGALDKCPGETDTEDTVQRLPLPACQSQVIVGPEANCSPPPRLRAQK